MTEVTEHYKLQKWCVRTSSAHKTPRV